MSRETVNSPVDGSDHLNNFRELQSARRMVTYDDLKNPLILNYPVKRTPLDCFIMDAKMNETLSSEDLMARVAKGDDEAFEILVTRHQTPVLNLIYRFLGDRAQAKDLAQEVFLRVWQTAKAYEPKAKFTTWIYRIATNLCFNELKAARRRRWFQFLQSDGDREVQTEEAFPDNSPSPEDLLFAKERSRQISEALQSLPANQRMALVLKRYDDLSYQQIAKVLGCSVSAVESLLVRAKSTLQDKLKKFEK